MPEEIAAAIRAIVKRGAPYQAHNALGYVRRLFSWAIGTHEFGIRASPVAQLKTKGPDRQARGSRANALGRGASRRVGGRRRNGISLRTIVPVIDFNGQREREVADMQAPEIDFGKRLWTIPAERMKGGRAHEVPLTPTALGLIQSLPMADDGDFIFTTTGGAKPINGFSKAKARIDKLSRRFWLGDLRSAANGADSSLGASHRGPRPRARHRARQARASPGL